MRKKGHEVVQKYFKFLPHLERRANQVNPNRVRGYDTAIIDIEVLALAGRDDEALERLREAVDRGWSLDWRFHLAARNLDGIRDRPEFQAIVATLEARLAEMAARWRATPHLGEFDLRDVPPQ